MRISKLIGALFAVLAFSAIATATSSAAETLWRWLPGSVGETFKGKFGKIKWQVENGLSQAFTSGEILLAESSLIKEGSTSEKDATLALAILHISGCSIAGLPCNSLGDASGIVLMHVEIHNCMIAKGDFGLLFLPLEVHIEVPASKLLLLLKGSFLALIEGKEAEKALTFKLNIAQTGGLQSIKKCEGGPEETLLTKVDEGAFTTTGIEAEKGTIEFDMIKDTAGEELMEK